MSDIKSDILKLSDDMYRQGAIDFCGSIQQGLREAIDIGSNESLSLEQIIDLLEESKKKCLGCTR